MAISIEIAAWDLLHYMLGDILYGFLKEIAYIVSHQFGFLQRTITFPLEYEHEFYPFFSWQNNAYNNFFPFNSSLLKSLENVFDFFT